ncbi:MAG TPA: exo-beta-N-acetylmuramidase NamZ domain-containing protein [Bryobacteraceae bacterium]|nr:exo-beta-N-acetylmuramidase NamZ domain-containing protein [Bryobacteraceae bacterium]
MRLLWCAALAATTLSAQTFSGAQAADRVINEAIQQGRLPGAVLLVGHDGQIVYRKAYGNRAVYPQTEAMTADTVFDLASLTKVIATTSSLMKLFEEGRFRLNDRITDYFPEFQGGHSTITIRNLFTHFSGLKPDVPLNTPWSGYDTGIKLACTDPPDGPPGVRYVYSDINFILLGELVQRLSGQPLSDYARDHVFQPLGMKETMFQPPVSLRSRIAPTERTPKDGPPLRGVVHDPTARNMGGVAGHAGLFSTADDLSRFAQMMINGGELDGVRFVSPLTIQKFTEPQSPPDQSILRGLGWDIDSPHSGNRGELFPIGSFGHTGFTGTSIWIDPSTKTYVILLANSVHPTQRPALTPLRGKVATIAAAAEGITVRGITLTGYNETFTAAGVHREVGRNGDTLTGLDVLESEQFKPLAGKHIGLITNHTGVDRQGRRNIDLMKQAGVTISALFSPEHGFMGREDHPGIKDSEDPSTSIRIFSLYGATMRPTPEMLKGLDALVFDIQDVGARFYTYETTMAYAMEAAAKAGIPYYVLDRPNPITGTRVEGPLLDSDKTSFVGYFAGIPVRHGMTVGELARLYNGEKKLGANLQVIPMQDWHRGDWLDATNFPWINPSPNMRSLNAALLYPGLCLLESSKNYSVGRGTDSPFEQVGADFIGGRELAAYLNQRQIPGVRVYPTSFTPTESNFKGIHIEGVRFVVTNRELFDSTRLGLEVASAMAKLYPGKIDFTASKRLIGNDDVIRRLQAGDDPRTIQQSLVDSVAAFAKLREPYLLYR